jgi:hypothetical protein
MIMYFIVLKSKANPWAEALAINFAGQWLFLREGSKPLTMITGLSIRWDSRSKTSMPWAIGALNKLRARRSSASTAFNRNFI